MERRRVILTRFDDAAAAGVALARQVAGALQEGLAGRGAGSMAMPGGRTPVALFRILRESALDWARIHVTLTDERWVPGTDPASNGALLCAELLRDRAASASFHPLYDGSASAADAARRVWESLQAMPQPFDAVVLGMGEDGHFASLFGGNAGLAAALDPAASPACIAMRAPQEPHERLSLTLSALARTRRLFLLVTGGAKHELLMHAARGEPGARWPVASLLALRQPRLEVYWAP
jgi:6-phosphogluconolactonase